MDVQSPGKPAPRKLGFCLPITESLLCEDLWLCPCNTGNGPCFTNGTLEKKMEEIFLHLFVLID